jgi:predicted acetyltransferase
MIELPVSLDAARPDDATLLGNLVQLYIHDLSAVFPDIAPGPDGRFSYRTLSLYWSEPTRRFPFLIRCGTQVAGFILVTRGSPVSEDPETFDVAEFFVMRRYRRAGVGREAAALLWSRLPGKWTVRVTEANRGGLAFWDGVMGTLGSQVTASVRPGRPAPWRVYAFDSASSARA